MAARKAQQPRESWVVYELDKVRPQEITRVGRVVYSRLVLIQIWCQRRACGHLQESLITLRLAVILLGSIDL